MGSGQSNIGVVRNGDWEHQICWYHERSVSHNRRTNQTSSSVAVHPSKEEEEEGEGKKPTTMAVVQLTPKHHSTKGKNNSAHSAHLMPTDKASAKSP